MTSHVQERLEELQNKVKKALAEKLGMTEEEVQEAMEVMGITFQNLLTGNGLAELVQQLSGAEDVTALLFQSDFQELMRQVDALVTEFLGDTGVTPEELDGMLMKLQSQAEQNVQAGEDVQFEVPREMVQQQEEENVAKTKTEIMYQEIPEETTVLRENVESTETAAIPQVDNQQEAEKEGQFSPENKQSQGFSRTPEKTEIRNDSPQNQIAYQTVETTVDTVGEQIVQTLEQTYVNAEDIVKQITEFTKISMQQAQTSLEMQLNPANLGKIYLHVMSKEGVITAQLAAQNEAVKQALESQTAVLRENMSQQGLKVEAVEVTIASHEFEQNLENDRQQAGQEQEGKQSGKSQRFLSAEQLDELSGFMTEEETLAAKIMLENGNSMDMTV